MSRTREWTKFGFLIAATVVLAVGFAAAIRLPAVSRAEEPRPVVLRSAPSSEATVTGSATDLEGAFVAAAEKVRPAVVFVESESERPVARGRSPFDEFFGPRSENRIRRGSGSGFIISPDGYIVTNNHVVKDATRLTVKLLDRRQFEATVVGQDPNTDIAVIKIDADDLPSVVMGESNDVRIGEWVLAVGNPLGEAFSFTVTAGIVSARGRRLQGLEQGSYSIHDFIQTDAAINPGNSGGPLVNIRGEVIGVNAAIASQTGLYTGYGFAIPIDLARHVTEQLIADGHVTRAVLGVGIQDADALDAELVGLDSIYGVRVESLSDDSPAARAGIQPGDVIIAVDGKKAEYTAQLQQDIGFRRPGDEVKVTVAREGGVRRTYTVRLGEAPTDQETAVARKPRDDSSGEDTVAEDRLGVEVQPVTAGEIARDAGVSRRVASTAEGLLITRVDPHGPARDSRLLPREIITRVNDKRVRTEADLKEALKDVPAGSILTLETARLVPGDTVQTRIVRLRVEGE